MYLSARRSLENIMCSNHEIAVAAYATIMTPSSAKLGPNIMLSGDHKLTLLIMRRVIPLSLMCYCTICHLTLAVSASLQTKSIPRSIYNNDLQIR